MTKVLINKYSQIERSDVTYYGIKDGKYVPIHDQGGDIFYGGRQNWFSDSKKFTKDYLIRKYGCGTIAVSDLFLYLALQDKIYRNNTTDKATKNNIIVKEDYMN